MNKCLNCAHWHRSSDPVIGFCLVLQGWQFQFEGGLLECPRWQAGDERKPYNEKTPRILHRSEEQVELDDRIADMVFDGFSLTDIRLGLGVANERIRRVMKERELTLKEQPKFKPCAIEGADLARLARLRSDGHSIWGLSKEFGVSRPAIRTALSRIGLQ